MCLICLNRTETRVCIFASFPTLKICIYFKSSPWKIRTNLSRGSHNQQHYCWWPGDANKYCPSSPGIFRPQRQKRWACRHFIIRWPDFTSKSRKLSCPITNDPWNSVISREIISAILNYAIWVVNAFKINDAMTFKSCLNLYSQCRH